jgi:F0F1-type ATP synthase assembly protein I
MARDKPARRDKAARAAAKGRRREQFKQLRAAFDLTRRNDPRAVPYLIAALLGPIVVGVVLGLVTGVLIFGILLGILVGLTAAMLVFTRRATKAAFAQVEGQTGAALAVLQSMRGDWRVSPAVAVTGNQDMVHRVLGRPGVVLVAEGPSRRVGALLGQEKKRVGRLVGDTPVYDIVVGDDEGQVSLRKLQQHFVKLPRNITAKQVNDLDKRLQALGGMNVPLPKGPLPKGARMPKGMPRGGRPGR